MRTLAVALAVFVAAACGKAKPASDTTTALPDSAKAAAKAAAKADSSKILGRDSVRQGKIIALPADTKKKP